MTKIMIPKLKINKTSIKKGWKDKEQQDKIKEYLCTLKDFKRLNVFTDSAKLFSYCFNGYEGNNGNLKLVDYGYAIDPQSIEKYILPKYGDNDENEYLVCCGVMSMDYEKPYKMGYFIDTDGTDTGCDFYEHPDCDELKKKAYVGNYWVTFSVYDLNRNGHGDLFSKEKPDWMKK